MAHMRIYIYTHTYETIITGKILTTPPVPRPLCHSPLLPPAQAARGLLFVTVGSFAFGRYKWNHRVWPVFLSGFLCTSFAGCFGGHAWLSW